ncbi:MAG: hypothetical protein M1470_02965 [Bacteroidetes bacterium]|nr:hypothetical protein [Bacteroidota bacterium]MCL5739228.1 hypothetical protein [Bacteroidota bacterium]
MNGWIKLHRQSLDSAVFQNGNLWQVWCWCLMKATHEEKKMLWNGQEIVLRPGQFLSGRFSGAKECHMKPSTFRNQIALLEELGNLDINSDSRSSLITVIKWCEFQENSSAQKGARTGERTPEGQPEDTIKKEKKEENITFTLGRDLLLAEDKNLYSVINRFKKEFGGEEPLKKQFAKILGSETRFIDARQLAAYLTGCLRNNGHGKATEPKPKPLPELSRETEPWLNG